MQKKAKKALDKFKKDYNRKVDYMIEGWHRAEYAKIEEKHSNKEFFKRRFHEKLCTI